MMQTASYLALPQIYRQEWLLQAPIGYAHLEFASWQVFMQMVVSEIIKR